MKVTFKAGISGFSGYLDEAVFYYHSKIRKTLMRRYPRMPHQPINDKYARIARQRFLLQPSEDYKTSFRTYTSILRDEDKTVTVVSWYNLFVKVLWAMQDKYPQTVNLETITRAQIYEQNLPCKSVKLLVEDGLLPVVAGYQTLTAEI